MSRNGIAFLLTFTAAGGACAEDLLLKGNEAYKEGRFEEAAAAYEGEENDDDILVRRFNAGVSWSRAGQVDKALERFQEVSSKASDELKGAALYNAGHAAFARGSTLADEAEKIEAPEERARKLAEAAQSFQQAVQLFRSIDPPSTAATRNLAVAKTALRAALDAIARLEAEEKRKAEDEALKNPAQLLKAITEKERMHRSLGRALASETGKSVRLGSRRLRKSTQENRALAEKLLHSLEAPPPAPAQPGQPAPQESEEEKARKAKAGEHVGAAIEAMKDAEIAYSKLGPLEAAKGHTKAVTELRTALEAFPLDIQSLIAEAVERQEGLNGAMDALVRRETGGIAPEVKGDGIGKKIVDAIKDKVLLPLARLVSPKSLEDAKLLADDEDDVVWGAGILSRAEIPPSPEPPAPQPGQSGPPPETQSPGLSSEEAKRLSDDLRSAGKEAHEASSKARDELAQGQAGSALPEGKKALEALKRAADLLPKPPKPPEERLKELIERQKQASHAVEAIASLEADRQPPARTELERTQRLDGHEAEGIAGELEERAQGPDPASQQGSHPGGAPSEQVAEAVKKIREGEEKVFSSAELLAQVKDLDAKTAVDRDIVLFQEALDLLQGKQDKQDEDEQKKDQQKKDQPDPKQTDQKKKAEQKPQAMSARDARFQQQEMDRKRREEEKKLFTAPSTLTVEKDW